MIEFEKPLLKCQTMILHIIQIREAILLIEKNFSKNSSVLVWKVFPYGQPDCKKSIFTPSLRQESEILILKYNSYNLNDICLQRWIFKNLKNKAVVRGYLFVVPSQFLPEKVKRGRWPYSGPKSTRKIRSGGVAEINVLFSGCSRLRAAYRLL